MKNEILKIINSRQGIKGVDLVLALMERIGPTMLKYQEFDSALVELIKEGEVVELEYVLPQMEYRIKSMYFPKNTVLRNVA